MILISVLYQNVFTSRILDPSPQGLISSMFKSKTHFLGPVKNNFRIFLAPFFCASAAEGNATAFCIMDRPI